MIVALVLGALTAGLVLAVLSIYAPPVYGGDEATQQLGYIILAAACAGGTVTILAV